MASGPEGTEPVNYQTWVLKVSIHCEGCKKKLKKILLKVQGVYSVEIDEKQNRVTVTGDVDGETLIRKLLKYGKHAELLPEKNPTTTTNSSVVAAPVAKTKAKGNDKTVSSATAAAAPETEEKQEAEQGKAVESPETPPAATASDEATSPNSDTDAPSKPEKKNSEKEADTDEDKKKKGKEVQREESRGDKRDISDSNSIAGVNSQPANPFPPNFQPLYPTVSYNTVHPSTSYAYYAAPPPAMSSSYGYYDYPPPPPPPSAGYSPDYYYSSESYYGSMEQPSPSAGSYDMFNDENPNACKLM